MIASPLITRLGTAIALLVPVAGIMLYGGAPLIALALLCFFIINYEFFSFATPYARPRLIQLTLASSLVPFAYLIYGFPGLAGGLLLATLLVFMLSLVLIESEPHEVNFSVIVPASLLGLCYTGLMGSVLVVLAHRLEGVYLLWLLLGVIGADTLAFFGGRSFGGPKFAPRISPNKTVSGAICGLLGAILASVLGAELLSMPFCSVEAAAYGSLIGVMAIFGDLAESLVKRVYEVKDSGSILPGHGGLLDRIDGLLFAAPVLFLLG